MTESREPLVARSLRRATVAGGRRALAATLLLAFTPSFAATPAPTTNEKPAASPARPASKKKQTNAPAQPSIATPPRAQPEKKTPPSKPAPVVRAPAGLIQRVVIPPPNLSRAPPELPKAPREKMRACADEWTQIKTTSSEPLPLWRDFAAKCLTR